MADSVTAVGPAVDADGLQPAGHSLAVIAIKT